MNITDVITGRSRNRTGLNGGEVGGLAGAGTGALLNPSIRTVLFLAFFLTGSTGLIYQVLWSRLLVLSFGYTIYSVSIVVTAFMGGLAIGSLLGGFIADRSRNPVLAYGMAEFGVGLIALLTYPLLVNLPSIIALLRGPLGIPFYGFSPWTFLIAMGILLPPTILMGLTLPLLARALTRVRESASLDLGGLYAVNTLGAAVGSILTGFVLIAFFGIQTTLIIAASINILIGVMAVVLRGSTARPGEAAASAAAPSIGSTESAGSILRAPVFWAFAVSGFASLAGEVVWVRLLAPYLENSTYAFSLILFIFLLGIAGGGWAGRKAAAGKMDPTAGFGICQILTGLATGAGLFLMFLFIARYHTILPKLGLLVERPSIILEQSAWIFLLLIPSTFFMGAGFPFLATWAAGEFGRLGGRTGKLYAGNTVGSIVGALAGGFVLLPLLGTKGSLVLITFLFAANGMALLYLRRGSFSVKKRTLSALGGVLMLLVAILWTMPDPNRMAIESAYRFSEVLAYREDPDVNVTLLAKFGDPKHRTLHLNLREVSGTGRLLTPWMVHLPMIIQDAPKDARLLNIGLGIGHTFHTALSLYRDLRVDVLELVPSVVDLFREYNPNGEKLLQNERGRVIVGDGRNFLLSADKPYNVILIDPTPPLYGSGAVNLYTEDFFRVIKDRLTEKGILLLRIPYSADEESVKLLLRTALEVFPYVSLWEPPFSRSGYSVVASSHVYDDMDPEFLARKVVEIGGVTKEWEEVLLKSQPRMIGKGRALLRDFDSVKVVTDDRPYLEFPLFTR